MCDAASIPSITCLKCHTTPSLEGVTLRGRRLATTPDGDGRLDWQNMGPCQSPVMPISNSAGSVCPAFAVNQRFSN
jgi:hypothetical protein